MNKILNFVEPSVLMDNEIIKLNKQHRLDVIINFVKKYSVNTNHGLFLNQLFGNTEDLSIIAEKIIAEFNTSMYTYEMAPVFTCMEKEITNELKKLFNFNYCDSLFLPGGSICNITAINTARYYFNPNIKLDGNTNDLVVLTSDQSHYSIDKACMLLGIGLNNLIKISTNLNGIIDLNELEDKIKLLISKNKKPFILIATACTTVLGAIDPINELSIICKKYKIWLHVDGAIGGSLIFSEKYKKLLYGIENVDSICFNPHKLLNINLQCSILLTSKINIFKESNCLNIAYLFNDDKYYDSEFDTGNKYFMCGRRPDVFKFWLVWKIKGKEHFGNLVNDIFKRCKYFKNKIRNDKNIKLILEDTNVNICFKVMKKNIFLDDNEYKNLKKLLIQKNIMIPYQKCKEFGNFFRICFVNSNSTDKYIDYLIETIKQKL
jgi:glutamate decarboxylase